MANEKRNLHNLTTRQQVFCDLYRASEDPEMRGNAKRCYMSAFNASASSAEHNGPRLLKNVHVTAFLSHKREQAVASVDITEERILQELACLAFFDPARMFDANGNLLHVPDMDEQMRRALMGIDVVRSSMGKDEDKIEFTTSKVKLSTKTPNLELLMKYMGMLKEKVEHSGEIKNSGLVLIPGDLTTQQWLDKHYSEQKNQPTKPA